jgi:hypothetical protein
LAHLHKASAGTHPRYESRVSKSFSAIRTQTIKKLKATKFTRYLNLNSNKNTKTLVSDGRKIFKFLIYQKRIFKRPKSRAIGTIGLTFVGQDLRRSSVL